MKDDHEANGVADVGVLSQLNSVLIVDESSEAREVLRTVLESRGLNILEAGWGDEALEMMQRHRPSVAVVDIDASLDEREISLWQETSDAQSTSLVVLGTTKRCGIPLPEGQILRKPYHYGPLVRTIEKLLENVRATN